MLAVLAGCSPSARATIELPALPVDLTVCDAPGDLPAQGLSRVQVEQLWARDRAALVRCGRQLGAVVGFYDDLRGELAGRVGFDGPAERR